MQKTLKAAQKKDTDNEVQQLRKEMLWNKAEEIAQKVQSFESYRPTFLEMNLENIKM